MAPLPPYSTNLVSVLPLCSIDHPQSSRCCPAGCAACVTDVRSLAALSCRQRQPPQPPAGVLQNVVGSLHQPACRPCQLPARPTKTIAGLQPCCLHLQERVVHLDCVHAALVHITITTQVLPAGPLKEKVVRLYTRQVVTGLEYLHGHHIMHRDIKGANILVDNAGKVKLADFGASKKIESLVTVGEETCTEVCACLAHLPALQCT